MSINKLIGTLVYVQVDAPKPCFVAEKGQEWKASIVVSEDVADEWDEAFPKQTAKQVKTSEFEAMYKTVAPFPEQRKQYIITLRKNTKLGNDKEVPVQYQPKVFQQKGNVLVDITHSALPSNGSQGAISVDVYEGKMGTFARLKNVLVTKLIEYVKQEDNGSATGSEFGLALADDGEGNEVKVPAKAAAKPKKAVPELDDDFDSSSDPF